MANRPLCKCSAMQRPKAFIYSTANAIFQICVLFYAASTNTRTQTLDCEFISFERPWESVAFYTEFASITQIYSV